MEIHEIRLEQIKPAPWNPPSRMDPNQIQELADSIKKVGQQSPALVRPVEAEAPVQYEIIFGHRRYAARKLLAATDPAHNVLRAEIREVDDAHAMILAGIENLQRQNFSDLEEAEFFQTCGEKYGETAVKILSERLSVSPRYIRKRLEILKLPEEALSLWRSGAWHVGHMEQLLRLGSNDRVIELLEELGKSYRRDLEELTVYDLIDLIGRLAIHLHSGHFDKEECKACRKNTDCQGRLFDLSKPKGARCLDQKCFVEKEQAWLDLNWAECKDNTYSTLAAVIGDYDTKTTGSFGEYSFSHKPTEKCYACSKFATILSFFRGDRLQVNRERVCLGEAECWKHIEQLSKQEENRRRGKDPKDPGAPRVAWHGEHFRQQFYQEEVPRLVQELPPQDRRHQQWALAVIVNSARTIHDWFAEKMGLELPESEREYFRLSFPEILRAASNLNGHELVPVMSEALAMIALRRDRGYEISFSDEDRQALAEFLNIDFGNFQVTEEYLQKKTKAEIVRFIINDSGLWDEPDFQKAAQSRGCVNEQKLAQAKKGVLVDLILNCGVDLRGRLPKEIADRPELLEEANGLR